ncbi:hypothetical protein V6N13_086219 [Hibiscus sabdariffa]
MDLLVYRLCASPKRNSQRVQSSTTESPFENLKLIRNGRNRRGWWIGTLVVVAIYCLRVYYVQGFYIVSYGLGIYLLNLLIGFLSPLVDPELEGSDGPVLPTKGSDEFKPFIRRLPEFKFWYTMTKAFCIAFLMTFFSIFDVPVFWPILLCYWGVLFVLTMRRQIGHMIKYKYIPFNIGKQKYTSKKASGSSSVTTSISSVVPTKKILIPELELYYCLYTLTYSHISLYSLVHRYCVASEPNPNFPPNSLRTSCLALGLDSIEGRIWGK